MEGYILDNLFRRIAIVDKFESFIWSERLFTYGDFELHLQSNLANRTRFSPGVRMSMNNSFRVMIVETVEDSTDADGYNSLKVTGRSLEAILGDRIARAALSDLTTDPKWILTGLPKDIASQIFHDICVTGILDAGDIIPFVIEGTIFPDDTVPAPDEEVTIGLDPTTVYDALSQICSIYNMGFRLVRNFDTSQLYFDVYTGSNRTTQQSDLPAVVFSPQLDNLQNTTELTTIALYKNCAYVISPVGHEVVYPLDVDPSTAGFDRHVLLVKADDITDPDPDIASALMIQRGQEELAKNRRLSAFDGELNQNGAYKYGTDYNLGDLVEQRNIDGVTNVMQVTEQIFISDSEGDRSYPTLSLNKFITPGSWSAWDYNQVWEDLADDDTTWADQP